MIEHDLRGWDDEVKAKLYEACLGGNLKAIELWLRFISSEVEEGCSGASGAFVEAHNAKILRLADLINNPLPDRLP